MEKKKVFKIIGSALLAALVLVLFVGLALAPAFSPKALSDDDICGSDVSTYANSDKLVGVWEFDVGLPYFNNEFYYTLYFNIVGLDYPSFEMLSVARSSSGDDYLLLYDDLDNFGTVTAYSNLNKWYDSIPGVASSVNMRLISITSESSSMHDDALLFLTSVATKLSDDPNYVPGDPDPDPDPPAPDPDPDPDPPAPDPGDGSYDEGYDDGYDVGYDEGYLAGFNDGVLDDLKNPLVFFVAPIASFLDTPLFAGVSIGDMLALLIFIFVGLIFLRMFAGG